MDLYLLPEAEVEGEEIFLSEVIVVQGVSPDILASLERIALGRAPLPGKTRDIGADYIRARLLQGGLSNLNLLGAKSVRVRSIGTPVSQDELLYAVREYISSNIDGSHLEIQPLSLPQDLLIPVDGELSFSLPQDRRLAGTILLPVEVTRQGTSIRRDTLKLRVSVIRSLYVASREIPKGQIIGEDDMALEERDMADIWGTPATDIVGKEAKMTIKEGTVIMEGNLTLPPAVRRREGVLIIARKGSVEVTLSGMALSDGFIGDLIEVENTSSKKRFRARVIGEGVVEVIL